MAIALVPPFATPFTIPGALLAIVAKLLLIHVVAAVVVVSVLTSLVCAKWGRTGGTFRGPGYGPRPYWGRYSVFVGCGIDSGANPYGTNSLGNSRRKESFGEHER